MRVNQVVPDADTTVGSPADANGCRVRKLSLQVEKSSLPELTDSNNLLEGHKKEKQLQVWTPFSGTQNVWTSLGHSTPQLIAFAPRLSGFSSGSGLRGEVCSQRANFCQNCGLPIRRPGGVGPGPGAPGARGASRVADVGSRESGGGWERRRKGPMGGLFKSLLLRGLP